MIPTIVTAGAEASDIDVLACVVSYAELIRLKGDKGIPVVPGSFTMSVTPEILDWNAEYETVYKNNGTENFVIVDISDPEHLPAFVDINRVVEVYDHRYGHQEFWGNKIGNNSHIEMVGSCGTLIWEEFKKNGFSEKISLISAKLLLASIVSNTLNFKNSLTTDRDKIAYKELKDKTNLGEQWIENYFVDQEKILLSNFKEFVRTDTKLFKTASGNFVISQIELWNAENIINTQTKNVDEIMMEFAEYPWILNIPSIAQGFNYIYSTSKQAKDIIEEKLGVVFFGDIAKTSKLIMRKEIMKELNNF